MDALVVDHMARQQVATFLRLHSVGARIVQACVMDHTDPAAFATPHIHIQLRLDDDSVTPWQVFNNVDVMTFQAEAAKLRLRMRIHLHEHKKPAVADKEFVADLPRLELTVAALSQLKADGASQCAICLEEYAAGERIIISCCSGLHKAHDSCMSSWLEKAASCPCCRFEFPSTSQARASRQ